MFFRKTFCEKRVWRTVWCCSVALLDMTCKCIRCPHMPSSSLYSCPWHQVGFGPSIMLVVVLLLLLYVALVLLAEHCPGSFLAASLHPPYRSLLQHASLTADISVCKKTACFPCRAAERQRAARRKRAALEDEGILASGLVLWPYSWHSFGGKQNGTCLRFLLAFVSPRTGLMRRFRIQLKWLCSELVGTGEISWQEWGRKEGILGRAAETKGAWFSRWCQMLFGKTHHAVANECCRYNRGLEWFRRYIV